jgi:two-component system NtrC family sensor kinase
MGKSQIIRLQSINTDMELSATFQQGEHIIGRHPKCAFEIPNAAVTREHACLEVLDSNRIYLTDLGSRNGTMVNGKRIESVVMIRPDDIVTFGEVSFRVVAVEQSEIDAETAPVIDMGQTLESAIVVPVSSIRSDRPGAVLTRPETFMALATMGRVAIDPDQLEDVLKRSLKLLHDALTAERLAVLSWEAESDHVQVMAQYATGPLAKHEFWVSRSVLDDVYERRMAMMVSHVEANAELSKRDSVTSSGLKSLMAVPLIADDEVLGVLYADTTMETQRFGDEHLQAFVTFADTLAAKIANFRLIRDRHEKSVIAAELRVANEKRAEIEAAHHALQEAQVQLVQSEKLASLGRLIAGILHELNNPLSVVKSNADMLARASEKSLESLEHAGGTDAAALQSAVHKLRECRGLSDAVKAGLDRVSSLLRSLKDFAGLDTPLWQESDIGVGLCDTVAFLRGELGEGISIDVSCEELPPVYCSLPLLNQAFMALILNAKESLDGTGSISVSTAVHDDQIEIRIRDTGIGISPEHIPHLFDPGFTTKKGRVKLGLGLAMCRKIVEQHNGSICFDSAPGKGTTVIMRLPLAGAPEIDMESTRRIR